MISGIQHLEAEEATLSNSSNPPTPILTVVTSMYLSQKLSLLVNKKNIVAIIEINSTETKRYNSCYQYIAVVYLFRKVYFIVIVEVLARFDWTNRFFFHIF